MMKILIADDHAIVRKGLVQILNEEFPAAEITEVANSNEVIEKVNKKIWYVILLDISMPGQNGIDCARQIMAVFPTCIVMLTANSDQHHMSEARSVGAAGYIPKPITSEHLLPALNQALQMFYECHP